MVQLGARYTGSVEVTGSNPVSSTIFEKTAGRKARFFIDKAS